MLTEQVRIRPCSLLLFEKVDKASRMALNTLIGMINSARLTDGMGRHVDFSNTLVLMTSSPYTCGSKGKEISPKERREKILEKVVIV